MSQFLIALHLWFHLFILYHIEIKFQMNPGSSVRFEELYWIWNSFCNLTKTRCQLIRINYFVIYKLTAIDLCIVQIIASWGILVNSIPWNIFYSGFEIYLYFYAATPWRRENVYETFMLVQKLSWIIYIASSRKVH